MEFCPFLEVTYAWVFTLEIIPMRAYESIP
jgi:hypothetical protein